MRTSFWSLRTILVAMCCWRGTQSMHVVLPFPRTVAHPLEEDTNMRTPLLDWDAPRDMAGMPHEHVEMEGQSRSSYTSWNSNTETTKLAEIQNEPAVQSLSNSEKLKTQSRDEEFKLLQLSMKIFERKSFREASENSQDLRDNFQELCHIHKVLSRQIQSQTVGQGEKDKMASILSPKELVDKLVTLLHKIGKFQIKKGVDYRKSIYLNDISLQSLVLKTIDYMHNHEFISAEFYKNILKTQNTPEIAIICLFFGPLYQTKDYFYHPSSYTFLSKGHFKYYKSIFEEIDMKDKVSLVYLFLKSHAIFDYKFEPQLLESGKDSKISKEFTDLMSSIFENDHFIDTLAKYQSVPKDKMEEFKKTLKFSELKKNINSLSRLFVEVGDQAKAEGREFQHRFLFMILEFVEHNYGEDLLEDERVNFEFMDKYDLMKSRSQFLAESDRIQQYFQQPPQDFSYFINIKNQENTSILEKFQTFTHDMKEILSENENILIHPSYYTKMENYCMLEEIKKECDSFEHDRMNFFVHADHKHEFDFHQAIPSF